MRSLYTDALVLLMASGGFTDDFPVHLDIAGGHARAYLSRDGEFLLPEGFAAYEKGREKHFIVPGAFTLHLPEGTYELRLERGLVEPPALKIGTWSQFSNRGASLRVAKPSCDGCRSTIRRGRGRRR